MNEDQISEWFEENPDHEYDWSTPDEFLDALHDDDVDHGPDSDLAHFLEDLGWRDEDWDFDVGDTPGEG